MDSNKRIRQLADEFIVYKKSLGYVYDSPQRLLNNVPMQFIRCKVEIRYLPDDMDNIYIMDHGAHYPIRRTNKVENGRTKRKNNYTINYGGIPMNLNYYGMSFNPFDKDIATKDAFLTNDIKEMNGRLDFIRNNPGIGVFTAEAGQGKTFALRYFSERLNPNITKFSYICLSTVTTTEFYRQLCVSLGLEASYRKSIMFKMIQDYFEEMILGKNIHYIICLDEAQYLSSEILRDLKMLTNFFMDSKNCFSLLLLGQPTLNSI